MNRGHAILGTSDHCIATHPSDVAVPLTALDAVVHTSGPGGERAIGIDDFFLLPGDTLQREHPLEHGELITAIEVPGAPVARRSVYQQPPGRTGCGAIMTGQPPACGPRRWPTGQSAGHDDGRSPPDNVHGRT